MAGKGVQTCRSVSSNADASPMTSYPYAAPVYPDPVYGSPPVCQPETHVTVASAEPLQSARETA